MTITPKQPHTPEVVGLVERLDRATWDRRVIPRIADIRALLDLFQSRNADLRYRIQGALEAALGDTYDCTRVWSAWGYGTMSEDDFTPVAERLDEIVSEVADTIERLSSQGEWMPIESAPKDGTLLELVVDYSDGEHPLQDAIVAPTIGYNGLADTGEDEWKFAGWCWSHDHFTEGNGRVIAWRPSRLNANGNDGSLGLLPTPPKETNGVS